MEANHGQELLLPTTPALKNWKPLCEASKKTCKRVTSQWCPFHFNFLPLWVDYRCLYGVAVVLPYGSSGKRIHRMTETSLTQNELMPADVAIS